jgi:ATP-dependent Clp protease protease subunit
MSALKFDGSDIATLLMDNYVDVVRRHIIVMGDVDEAMFMRIMLSLDLLEGQNRKPITIKLYSSGGEVYAGFGIYDRIKLSPCKITIEGWGQLMSMATVILQAADLRLLSPNARMMIHYGSTEVTGNTKDVIKFTEFVKTVDEPVIEGIYLERIRKKNKGFTQKQLEKLLSTDTYLLPDRVIGLGLADGLVGERKK